MVDNSPIPEWRPRQIVLGTLYLVLVIGAFLLLVRFRDVIFILFVAIVISTAITPAVEWLYRRGLPRPAGVILIYLLIAAMITGFLLLVAPLIVRQGVSISTILPSYYTDIREWFINSDSYVLRRLGFELPTQLSLTPPPDPAALENPEEAVGRQVAGALTAAGVVSRTLFSGMAVFLLAFYWTLDGERTIRSLLLLIPQRLREGTREIILNIQSRVGAFVAGQLFLCLTIGVLSLIAYVLIGIPNALLLAVFAGIMEAVPVFGPTLGAVPAVLLALATDQTSKVLWIIGATVVIQFLENNLLVPRVGKSVGVNPIVTLLALAAFSSLFGLAGAVLAIPLAAVFQLLLDRFVLSRKDTGTTEMTGRDALSAIRLEVQELSTDVRKHVREKEESTDQEADEVEDAIEHLANELDEILAQATNNRNGEKVKAV